MEAILFGEIQMTASSLSSIAAIGEYHVSTLLWKNSKILHDDCSYGSYCVVNK